MEQRVAGTDDDASRLYRERRKGDSRSYPGLKEQKGTRKGSHARKNGLEIYNKYAEKQIAEAFGGYHDWSVFENEHAGLTCGKLTGTAVLLKACAKLRPLDSCA